MFASEWGETNRSMIRLGLEYSQMVSRSEQIRRHSENYGMKFCAEQGPFLANALTHWRDGDSSFSNDISIRAYDSSSNSLREVTLTQVLEDMPLRDGRPLNPRPNDCGQVMLKPDLSVSTSIYHMLVGGWYLTMNH